MSLQQNIAYCPLLTKVQILKVKIINKIFQYGIDYTSHLLKTKVLYLETQDERFELAKTETADDDLFKIYDTYKFSKIINPLLIDNEFMNKSVIPLPDQY